MAWFPSHITGNETYENQKEYGTETFKELIDLNENGMDINGIHHQFHVTSCCDWKAQACIEGMKSMQK